MREFIYNWGMRLEKASLHVKKPFFVFALIIVPLGPVNLSHTSIPLIFNEVTSISDSVLQIDEEITFLFDHAQEAENVRVSLSPQTPFTTLWSEDHRTLRVIPQTTWRGETDYIVSLGTVSADSPSILFRFATEGYPKILTYTSSSLEKSRVTIVPGTEITFHLDTLAPKTNVKALVRPHIAHDISLNRDDNTIVITFTEDIAQKMDVEMLFYANLTGTDSNAYYPIGSQAIKAFPVQKNQWPEDQVERVTASATSITPQIITGKYIDVNLTARITTLFENGEIIEQFINSPGAVSTPTPAGRYKVENKAERPLSPRYNVYLPYWLGFTPDGLYGLHGLIEWPVGHEDQPGGGKESPRSIDNAVSPGCVRHTDDASVRLYEWTPVGTPVIIYE